MYRHAVPGPQPALIAFVAYCCALRPLSGPVATHTQATSHLHSRERNDAKSGASDPSPIVAPGPWPPPKLQAGPQAEAEGNGRYLALGERLLVAERCLNRPQHQRHVLLLDFTWALLVPRTTARASAALRAIATKRWTF
jgi:hypothetical protein